MFRGQIAEERKADIDVLIQQSRAELDVPLAIRQAQEERDREAAMGAAPTAEAKANGSLHSQANPEAKEQLVRDEKQSSTASISPSEVVAQQSAEKPQKPQEPEKPDGERVFRAPMPDIKLRLKFPLMPDITQAKHYIKYVPEVFREHMIFDWSECDYEFSNKDVHFLRALNRTISAGSLMVNGAPLRQS